MDQNTLKDDMIESIEAFNDQFDENSIHYHNGVKTLVPTGGARVPESMPTVYPQQVEDLNGYISKQNEQVSYGAEYDQCIKLREFFNVTLKKALQKACMQIEALYRHQETFKKSDKPIHGPTYEKNMQKDSQILKEAILEIYSCIEYIDLQPAYKERYSDLHNLVEQVQSKHDTKEQVADFGFAAKKLTAFAFKDSQLLMDQIKQIKKAKDQPKQNVKENGQVEELKKQE